MSISERTRKILWGRSGNRCAICGNLLVIAVAGTDQLTVVGEECHIHSPRPGGPRFDAQVSNDALHVEANLILLCASHHKVIDDNVALYPADTVRAIKARHENAQRSIASSGDVINIEYYTAKLTSIVISTASASVLYGSVGEADFAATWLPRLLEGYQYRLGEKPKISEVNLRRLSDGAIHTFVTRQLLDPHFGTRLNSNLARLRAILSEVDIALSVTNWTCSSWPPFHGWLFGDILMRGDWVRGVHGHYHVRTPLKLYDRHSAPELFALTHSYFL